MSVGAVHYDYYNLGRIADYSSRGPTTDGRIKPELVAPTGVSTVSYGKSDFYGYNRNLGRSTPRRRRGGPDQVGESFVLA